LVIAYESLYVTLPEKEVIKVPDNQKEKNDDGMTHAI